MSLRSIVAALGGDLHHGGQAANVPAPGHAVHDRSISLLASGSRLVIHSFGGAHWREVLTDLQRRGLVDAGGQILDPGGGGVGGQSAPTRPDASTRVATAQALWRSGRTTGGGGLLARHLALRGVNWSPGLLDLLEHPNAPLAVYGAGGGVCRAMMAAVRGPGGVVSAVELAYLAANGRPPPGLRLPRKTVGVIPAGSAVRLSAPSAHLLVAEGVVTTLSAMARFGLPGWALLSAGNLARWSAPEGVDEVLIAGDRGRAGEAAAAQLAARLRPAGLRVRIALPPAPWGDWNEAATGRGDEGRKEGRGGAPAARG